MTQKIVTYGEDVRTLADKLNAMFSELYGGARPGTTPVYPQGSGTVASLPSPLIAGAGARSFVTDSTVAGSGNFGATVVGGGSAKTPVYCDGTNWLIG